VSATCCDKSLLSLVLGSVDRCDTLRTGARETVPDALEHVLRQAFLIRTDMGIHEGRNLERGQTVADMH
jgi:hypothetical protein